MIDEQQKLEKIIILDRDGVINQDSKDYIKSPAEWIPIEGSLEAIARLSQSGYAIFVITNQSGIARGLYSEQVLAEIHSKMISMLKEHNGNIKKIYYCPHGPNDNCPCRKPKSGMYEQLSNDFNINFNNVVSIGDSIRDLEAAQKAGASPVLVLTGNGQSSQQALGSDPNHPLHGTPTFANLAEFTTQLLNQ